MDDRELLELAAKAAGISGGWGEVHALPQGEIDCTDLWFLDSDDQPYVWNPLTDDGDALRLAATLKISVEWCAETDHVSCCLPGSMGANGWERATPEGLRRAIVRAAAEIGRSMPCPTTT